MVSVYHLPRKRCLSHSDHLINFILLVLLIVLRLRLTKLIQLSLAQWSELFSCHRSEWVYALNFIKRTQNLPLEEPPT